MRWRILSLAICIPTLVTSLSACGDSSPPPALEPAAESTPSATPTPTPERYRPPHTRPGPAADRIYFRAAQVDTAPLLLENGEIDFYVFGLKTEGARSLAGREDIRLYEAPALTLSLLLNPAPASDGELNPFSLPDVRRALQYLVNREFIAQEIYRGLALPMYIPAGPFDFDYLTAYDVVHEHGLTYDPVFARELVTRSMTGAGARLVDGRWHFNGRPLELKFIIRVEDARRDIGDLVRAELEKLGFAVDPSYDQFAAAISKVFSTDPKLLGWHLYTEGWGKSAAGRYDYSIINQMTAPWYGNMPGWLEEGFWLYTNPTLDDLGQRLFSGDFSGLEERNRLYREMTKISLDESVRIWLATVVSSFPALKTVKGVTQEVAAGPKGFWTLREAHIPGKDTLTVGNLWVWTERTTWNPVGGFGDLYSRDIWRNVYDPVLARHPFTGLPIPFRAQYQVETAGVGGKLDLPADALLWDADAGAFTPVDSGAQATSKVTFDYSSYLQSRWHHGQPITMADLVYSIYQSFDITYDQEKSRIEAAVATSGKPYLDTIRGFRLVGDSKLEVYVDYWHFVPDLIAEYATLAGLSTPWEIRAAMDQLVFEERSAAYTDTAANRFGVDWLSLVLPRDSQAVKRVLMELREKGQFPAHVFQVGDATLVTREEALGRYAAAVAWIDDHCTSNSCPSVISNGPFMLERFDVAAQFAELVAFRDPSYPFKPGDWYFGSAQLVSFADIQAKPVVAGRPSQVEVELDGPGELGLRYLLLDPVTKKSVAKGEAESTAPGRFTIPLSAQETGNLSPGLYVLFLAGFSDAVSAVTEQRVDLEVTAG